MKSSNSMRSQTALLTYRSSKISVDYVLLNLKLLFCFSLFKFTLYMFIFPYIFVLGDEE